MLISLYSIVVEYIKALVILSKSFQCQINATEFFIPEICIFRVGVTPTLFNPFPNKSCFLYVSITSILKTLREKEKLLVTSNFSFSHSVFYPFGKLSAILIKFEIDVCELTVGKGEVACPETCFFPAVFSKGLHCRHIKTRACWEWVFDRTCSFYFKKCYRFSQNCEMLTKAYQYQCVK